MRVIEVTIAGTKPLLQNNPASMAATTKSAKKDVNVPAPDAEARTKRYLMPDGSALMVPAAHIHAALIVVAAGYTPKNNKRLKLTPFVAGCVEVSPEHISLGTLEYTVDTRRAVIQGKGVLRSRPKVWPWKVSFELLIGGDFPVDDLTVFRQMLEETGSRVGIGDFRPQKKGQFGKFVVTRFEERVVAAAAD